MMIENFLKPTGILCYIILFVSYGQSQEIKLFNGESLEGWEGSNTFFRVEKEAIVGGSLKKPIDKSYYLCTKQKYENFELK
ncbi:MAG: family 16 glycoside hydrolase [Aurantibacter sp.]